MSENYERSLLCKTLSFLYCYFYLQKSFKDVCTMFIDIKVKEGFHLKDP